MSDLRTVPKHTALLIGLMIFGLFFGAGNLIFPVELG
ncbi:branched-chain amino acid transport system II carrier protein, partial [Cutibacterium sp.]